MSTSDLEGEMSYNICTYNVLSSKYCTVLTQSNTDMERQSKVSSSRLGPEGAQGE
jgi:hypothetical protein